MNKCDVSIDDVRKIARPLPRSYEVLVRDRVKFRIGQIVWLAFTRDETQMGFAFPKDERDALIAAEPKKFFLPQPSELRFNWIEANLDQLELNEVQELVLDAWRMVVPKRVAKEYLKS
jgi:hypothetical protein